MSVLLMDRCWFEKQTKNNHHFNFSQKVKSYFLVSGSCTVVKHFTHHPRIKGSSPLPIAHGREKSKRNINKIDLREA